MSGQRLQIPAATIYFIALLVFGACSKLGRKPTYNEALTMKGSTMGTFYSVTIASHDDSIVVEDIHGQIRKELEVINAQMSTYDLDSDISRFNAHTDTTAFEVAAEVVTVIRAALKVSEETNGAFDITVGPLVDLWGFGPEKPSTQVPTEVQIDSAKALVGYTYLHIVDDTHIRKSKPGLRIDLSAIAKGYGVDKLGELIESHGYENYLVDIGGEILAKGLNQGKEPWKVGIDKPEKGNLPGEEIQSVLALTDVAVATSGDYRNFTEIDGRIYSHEIDPVTGRPVEHGMVGATVIAPTCMMADAYATACMILGVEKGLSFVQKQQSYAVLSKRANTESYAITVSPGFEQYFDNGEE